MTNKLSQFWRELQRRRVIHVIVVYATAAYVIIELVNNIAEPLHFPEWLPTIVILLLIIGFPIAIILSWIFDITLKGIVKTDKIEHSSNPGGYRQISDTIKWYEDSIAVLPFEDMSPEKDQEYFCDGITDEIINSLTHVESLKVIARTSAFAFKNKHVDVREIGKQLDVETLVEGSIRKSGSQIRITVQLIEAKDGSHLWSNIYNRELEDVFAIQEEISLSIAESLKIKLLRKERAGIVKRHTNNLEAYNLYLRGNYCSQLFTADGYIKADDFYHQALQEDQNFALAYYGLGANLVNNSYYGNLAPTKAYPKARLYLKNALELDNCLAEAHGGNGVISMFYDWNWTAAERDLKQALLLNPNSATVHLYYSWFLIFTGQYDQAIAESLRALELDPLSSLANTVLGYEYLINREYDNAIEKLQWTLTIYPKYFMACYFLGHAFRGKSMINEAIVEYEKAASYSGDNPMVMSWLACAYVETGRKEQAEEVIINLKKRMKYAYVPATSFVPYYILNDDLDQACKWLEKAVDEHDSFIIWRLVLPVEIWQFPKDPKFRILLKKVGLEKFTP